MVPSFYLIHGVSIPNSLSSNPNSVYIFPIYEIHKLLHGGNHPVSTLTTPNISSGSAPSLSPENMYFPQSPSKTVTHVPSFPFDP